MDNYQKHFYCAAEKGKDVAKISPKFKRVHESFLSPKLFSAKIKRSFVIYLTLWNQKQRQQKMKTKKTKMLMSFKSTFCNKNRQTQKFVLNSKI